MEFIDALCLTDKRVTRVEWLWRYNLMTGTVMLAMTDIGPRNCMAALSDGQADASRADEFRAPPQVSIFVERSRAAESSREDELADARSTVG